MATTSTKRGFLIRTHTHKRRCTFNRIGVLFGNANYSFFLPMTKSHTLYLYWTENSFMFEHLSFVYTSHRRHSFHFAFSYTRVENLYHRNNDIFIHFILRFSASVDGFVHSIAHLTIKLKKMSVVKPAKFQIYIFFSIFSLIDVYMEREILLF